MIKENHKHRGRFSVFNILSDNAKTGPGLKWFFYLFYPGHLFLMYCIRMFLLGYWKL